MPVTVRRVERRDLKAVISLLQEISTFYPAEDTFEDIWRNFSSQINAHSFVVEALGEVVGYGSVLVETKIRGGRLGHIEDIVVCKSYQRRSVGRLLLEELYRVAASSGCYKVALHCHPENTAFYENCGYVSSGTAMQRLVSNSIQPRPFR